MKYMGSKRAMLKNGLGLLLQKEINEADRFVDLFTGSGTVAAYVATRFPVPVLAVDLQEYGAVLAHAVVGRCRELDHQSEWKNWYARAKRWKTRYDAPQISRVTKSIIVESRAWASGQVELPIVRAYGGHYFCPEQALWLDAFRATIPASHPARTVALAALIQATSCCAAAPGHTAQPFQPTRGAKRFLAEGWRRNIVQQIRDAMKALASMHAKRRGEGRVGNANIIASDLNSGDLVFLDPPYSGVHYSRFYHVLETVAKGLCSDVSGVGRYPVREERPRSSYSVRSESSVALDELLRIVASRGAKAILTFPDHECSNGLSGSAVRSIAKRYFDISEESVPSTFSTLGGTNGHAQRPHRAARKHTDELILLLRPPL